jgi:hypothetical protein
MKSASLHKRASEFLIGYSDTGVHVLMDAAVKRLGPQHRQVNHIYPFIEAVDLLFGRSGKMVALLHLLLDMDIIDSKYVESILPKQTRKKRSKK